jgi:hypothetical protein
VKFAVIASLLFSVLVSVLLVVTLRRVARANWRSRNVSGILQLAAFDGTLVGRTWCREGVFKGILRRRYYWWRLLKKPCLIPLESSNDPTTLPWLLRLSAAVQTAPGKSIALKLPAVRRKLRFLPVPSV